MRVLVIGGSGLVGGLVLPRLAERHDLRVFDLKPPRSDVDVEYVAGDLRDVTAVTRAVEGVDAVMFMAMGPMAGWGSIDNARMHLEVAVPGLHVALRAAHEAGVTHAVYTSSMSVYAEPAVDDPSAQDGPEGGPENDTSISPGVPGRERYPDESTPPDGTDFYGLAKRLGEEVCRNAVEVYGMSVVALRLCHPVADADFPRTDHPRARLICTSARDVARALLAALDRRGHGFEPFAISGDGAERLVPMARAREVLGWTPLDSTDQPDQPGSR
ncbi:Nucleoside-diphosphate-sugar epimerase [Actinopolymorpha cephalotaxi]|uniref:Nucleoside-diphosphate-sugar epimerase n=1 Tax=Actinopolymorpha cephalotaxi TaxID=504797 RepID=A0A1I2KC21_9ACTN|nr:NAD(P)-dependent oxidoreductase [Actinopolymorpha cephalotaxi]NYH84428.1 nucleoside-diphosphate-sugar epimerase [Actinopolymorpha cephalotaxi]SFF64602.1 Nucleoside-diphosphate-sugar epimerase [Actinopolymorpha cephalotaxi]